MMNRHTRYPALALACVLFGCSDAPTAAPRSAARVVITNDLPSLFAGDTLAQRSWGVDTEGDSITDRVPVWTSANTAIATVDAAGVITGVAPGTTTLTAELDTAAASVVVAVLAPPDRALREVAWLQDSAGMGEPNDILKLGTIAGGATATISPFGTFVRQFTFSPNGERLLLQAPSGAWAMMDWDGSNHVPLPDVETFPEGESAPDWSPDGSLIVFAKAPPGTSLSSIQVRSLATGIYTIVTTEDIEGYEPRWSPDGRRLAYLIANTVEAGRHLVLAAPNGSEFRTIGLTGQGVGAAWLRWSPDGKLLAYADEDGVYIMTPDGRFVQKLSAACNLDLACTEEFPEWAPDAKRIAFVRRHPLGAGSRTLVIRNVYLPTEITVDLGLCCESTGLSWSPDGEWIGLTQKVSAAPDAWAASVVRADGTGLQTLGGATGTSMPRFRR